MSDHETSAVLQKISDNLALFGLVYNAYFAGIITANLYDTWASARMDYKRIVPNQMSYIFHTMSFLNRYRSNYKNKFYQYALIGNTNIHTPIDHVYIPEKHRHYIVNKIITPAQASSEISDKISSDILYKYKKELISRSGDEKNMVSVEHYTAQKPLFSYYNDNKQIITSNRYYIMKHLGHVHRFAILGISGVVSIGAGAYFLQDIYYELTKKRSDEK